MLTIPDILANRKRSLLPPLFAPEPTTKLRRSNDPQASQNLILGSTTTYRVSRRYAWPGKKFPVSKHTITGAYYFSKNLVQVLRMSPSSPELPAEIWGRILHPDSGFTKVQLKSLCLVCHLFRDFTQPHLFRELSASPRLQKGYFRRNSRGFPMPEWLRWRKDLAQLIRSERRFYLVADDSVLCRAVEQWTVDLHSEPPAPAIPDDKPLTSDIVNSATRLRNAMVVTLPSFTRLRRLELCGLQVDKVLLATISSHPTLEELQLAGCVFPDLRSSKSTPMVSASTLELHRIDRDHRIAAYRLIPLEKIATLSLEFSAHCKNFSYFAAFHDLFKEVVFKELRQLRLILSFPKFRHYPVPVHTFLTQMPHLRSLVVDGPISRTGFGDFPANEGRQPFPYAIPPTLVPHLECIDAPLPWARNVVPGRPIQSIKLQHFGPDYSFPNFNEKQVTDLLLPLTLSSAPITTFHLPSSPVLAPLPIIGTTLTKLFPSVRDLRIAVETAETPRTFSRTGPTHTPHFFDDANIVDPDVEDVTTEKLLVAKEEVTQSVEKDLQSGGLWWQSPTADYRPATSNWCAWDDSVPNFVRRPELSLDTDGKPTRDPEGYEETLTYLARGFIPLPTSIQKLTIDPKAVPGPLFAKTTRQGLRPFLLSVLAGLSEQYGDLTFVQFSDHKGCTFVRHRGQPGSRIAWEVLL